MCFGGYLRKKGENLATHQDIEKLKEQVAAVTTTTEQIKTEISDAAWNRQKRWELKREVLFEAAKTVTRETQHMFTKLMAWLVLLVVVVAVIQFFNRGRSGNHEHPIQKGPI